MTSDNVNISKIFLHDKVVEIKNHRAIQDY